MTLVRTSRSIAHAVVALVLLCLAACGKPAGVILQPSPDAPRWPAPPDQARVAYLGELHSDQDLKPARSGLSVIGSALFGDTPPKVMTSPLAVCTDGESRVFVVDNGQKVVHVFDLATRAYTTWTGGPAGRQFSMPVAIAWVPGPDNDRSNGRVLVSDSVESCVFVLDRNGMPISRLGEGHLKRPCGIAIADNGRIFIADIGAHQIVVFAPSGEEIRRLGERGSGPGQFNYPTNVAFDHQGRLYVSDSLNFRVQVFDRDLSPLPQIGKQGDVPGYFAQPKGVASDEDNHIYVVDANFEAVQLFTTGGDLLMSMGREGRGPGEFWLPAGIHIDPKGRIWIADSYNQRVQVFQYLREGGQP